jgi:hypothetical protein
MSSGSIGVTLQDGTQFVAVSSDKKTAGEQLYDWWSRKSKLAAKREDEGGSATHK